MSLREGIDTEYRLMLYWSSPEGAVPITLYPSHPYPISLIRLLTTWQRPLWLYIGVGEVGGRLVPLGQVQLR